MTNKGFTLIELLVVVAIIGMLSSVVLAALSSARNSAADTRRVTDLKTIQTSLELYHGANGSYPATTGWRSECSSWGGHAGNNVIPGLVPTYLPVMPSDPRLNATGNDCCYLYRSDGDSYKVLAHTCSGTNYTSAPTVIDPRRDGGTNNCTVDGSGIWSWAVWSDATSMCW